MMKKRYLIRIVPVLAVLAMVFVMGNQGIAASSEPIKVGYIGALSGNSATMGAPIDEGLQMAFEEVNKSGGINGRQIELIATDDEADPAKSVTQALKLIQNDKVVLIIGGPNRVPLRPTVRSPPTKESPRSFRWA